MSKEEPPLDYVIFPHLSRQLSLLFLLVGVFRFPAQCGNNAWEMNIRARWHIDDYCDEAKGRLGCLRGPSTRLMSSCNGCAQPPRIASICAAFLPSETVIKPKIKSVSNGYRTTGARVILDLLAHVDIHTFTAYARRWRSFISFSKMLFYFARARITRDEFFPRYIPRARRRRKNNFHTRARACDCIKYRAVIHTWKTTVDSRTFRDCICKNFVQKPQTPIVWRVENVLD